MAVYITTYTNLHWLVIEILVLLQLSWFK